ncbi:protein cramped-like [Protopterus annectens]|uniref:protein cramped-like n=1 Tax=Protopterus annectens TaxID=7888 RepID=UPI001CFA0E66|nr:protein cramped-like [Protopterus annectens]
MLAPSVLSSGAVFTILETRSSNGKIKGYKRSGMTVKLGDGSGDEGVKKWVKRTAGGEEVEAGDEAGGGELENGECSNTTKREENINSSSLSPQTLQQASSPCVQPSLNQDQHHFLRSSVRPPSKRLRKDSLASSASSSNSSAKGKAYLIADGVLK